MAIQSKILSRQQYFPLGWFTRGVEASNDIESYDAGQVIEAGHPVKLDANRKVVNIVAADVQNCLGVLVSKVSFLNSKPVSCEITDQVNVACTGFVGVKVATTTGLVHGATAQYNVTTKVWEHVTTVKASKFIFTGNFDTDNLVAEIKILENFVRT